MTSEGHSPPGAGEGLSEVCFQWETGEQGMLIRKESKLTRINSSHHHFSPGKDAAAEPAQLPASIGTTELGGGDGPSPATPSPLSNVTNDTPCPWVYPRQLYGGGKMPPWQHQHQHSILRPSPTHPQMGAGASLLPRAMEVTALTHKVWVRRVWQHREGGRETCGGDETNRGWERLATASHRRQAGEKRGK